MAEFSFNFEGMNRTLTEDKIMKKLAIGVDIGGINTAFTTFTILQIVCCM